MGIEATSTSTVSVAGAGANTNAPVTSSKTNSDASFKDEMTKVSNTEEKKESKEVSEKKSDAAKSNEQKDKGKVSETLKSDSKKTEKTQSNQDSAINTQININNQLSLNDANMMLTSDIAQMIENTSSVSMLNDKSWTIGFGTDSKNSLQMNESDAQFFLNLTHDGDVSMQNIAAQGQGMLNSGADTTAVAQNMRVSQTLLNALNDARQNNQPIRIDFDQNISVILRVGRDGAIAAQFIPGDKVAEQYLRNNISELRNAFDEQELPYTELSYSTSSKEQNKKRRQQAQQGE